MKIRDCNAALNGEFDTITMPSGGLEIIGEDGRCLYTLGLNNGELHVQAGNLCKVNGVVLDDKLTIAPKTSNFVVIQRPKYEQK